MTSTNGSGAAWAAIEGLYVDPAIPRYTRSELVAEMADRFGNFSDGTFRDYQDKGLVTAPRRAGRWVPGQPGSTAALWSDNDRRMLIAVLELRERHRHEGQGQLSLANLANFVVWSWAYWDGFVELPQVKKALATWVAPQLNARSEHQLRRLAGQTVRRLSADGASRASRTTAAEQLKKLYWYDDPEELPRLRSALRAIIDPGETGRQLGPARRPVDADDIILAMEAHFLAAEAITHNQGVFTGEDWNVARLWARQAWAEYCHDWDRGLVVGDRVFADEEPDQGLLMRSAGRVVLYGLGIRLIERVAVAHDGE
jgi:hypothetical protein